jgi:hypothetical protein
MNTSTEDDWIEQRKAVRAEELHNQARPSRPDYVEPPADAFADPDVDLAYDRNGNVVGWHYRSTGTREKS